mgnify:CR=1 FL=1
MLTVNSLSGGKTSSYIAANYPADLDVFALCCIDNHNANAHYRQRYKDEKMLQRVNDKLQKYCSNWPEFVATSEDPQILWTIFDLEQMIGRHLHPYCCYYLKYCYFDFRNHSAVYLNPY